jgi:hypothetical protein
MSESCSNLPTSASGGSSSCQNVQLKSTRSLWACSDGTVSRLNYSNSESMSAIISYPAAIITFTFNSFNTEANYDILQLSSCTDISCSSKTTVLLEEYSGSTIPSPVTSTTGFMLLEWRSDHSTTRTGWGAFWATVGESHHCQCFHCI